MKTWSKHILYILGGALLALLLIVLLTISGLSLWLRTDKAQQQIFQYGITLLQEKLQTNVSADSISIELLKGQVRLYGVQVNDRNDSLLIHIDELHAGIAPHELHNHRVVITDAEVLGAEARLWRDSLTSNFQFIAEAFRKQPKTPKKEHREPKMELVVDVQQFLLQNIHVKWDVRHKQRKNINKPNRGAFDANHVDVTLDIQARVKQPAEGTYDIHINELQAHDHASGLHICHLSTQVSVNKEQVAVENLLVQLPNSQVSTQPFAINLKQKDIAQPFLLTARVLLQDLAEPFAPPLSHFTTPLELQTLVSGPLNSLLVNDIQIQTPDKRLMLTAKGRLDSLFAKKEKLNLTFDCIDLRATDNMKEQIVMHFAKKVRLKMIRQLKAIGDIHFQGNLQVLYKQEIIAGRLHTKHGYLDTRFTIDGFTRSMIGYLKTPAFDMGRVMNIDKLGKVNCRIDFDLNVSKKTPRPASALPNGRLPMGKITAQVHDARYSTVSAPEVKLSLLSDGSTATGTLWMPGSMQGMSAQVSYVQTDQEQRVWFHFAHEAQQWLLHESTNLLSDKLQAKVEGDSINVHLFEGTAKLYGIRVYDQQNKQMLSMDTLSVSLDAQELLQHQVHITNVGLYGLQANLNKDSVDANFRFVLNSFQKKTPEKKKDTTKKKPLLQLIIDLQELNIENMQVKWDKTIPGLKQPRSNKKRGSFDINHIDALLNLQASFRQTAEGAYALDLHKMNLTERLSGLQIDDLHTHALWQNDRLLLDGLYLRLPESWISAEPLTLNLKQLRLEQPFLLRGHVVPQEIALPLLPIFSNFSTPLDLQALVGGDLQELVVNDVSVQTPNGKMNLTGKGTLGDLASGKEALNLRFRQVNLHTDNQTLLQLVSHFTQNMRMKMLRQLQKVGDVHFEGDLDVLYKREHVAGRLNMDYGEVVTDFTLNDSTHYMTGYVEAIKVDAGKFLNVKRLGTINGRIDFNFNTNTKAPSPATALPNGRLPEGNLQATIHNARYGMLHAKQIEATADSDGSTATGTLRIPKVVSDLIVYFSYIQTDNEQRLKVRPKLKFNLFRKRKVSKFRAPKSDQFIQVEMSTED